MEPLSVAGSVVGLICAGAKLVPMLYDLGSAIRDSPEHAHVAAAELGDITIVLTQLQRYINGQAHASIQRLNLITVEHITATLTECVMTYSELDALLKSLRLDQGVRAWDRGIWLIKKDSVGLLTARLQNHKSTFGLILNIIQCVTIGEAESSMDRLCDMVNEVVESNKLLFLRLRNLESTVSDRDPGPYSSEMNAHQTHSEAENKETNSQRYTSAKASMRSVSIASGRSFHTPPRSSAELVYGYPSISAFEDQLYQSHVYRHAAGRHSQSSLIDDGRSTLAISICSSLTLGNVSKISVYALPIYASELSNASCYDFGRAAPPVESSRVTQGTDSVHAQTMKTKTPKRPTAPSFWWKWRRKSLPSETLTHRPSPASIPEAPIPEPRVFGVALDVSFRYTKVEIVAWINEETRHYSYLPTVIAKCGHFLKDQSGDVSSLSNPSMDTTVVGIKAKGIFAVTGSPVRIQKLQTAFETPPYYGQYLQWSTCSFLDASSILLRYLLQLPEPIVPHAFYWKFRAPILALFGSNVEIDYACYSKFAAGKGDPAATNVVNEYLSLIAELPPLRRHVLLYIIDLLALICDHSDTNDMDIARVAAIFQPAILSVPEHRLVLRETMHAQVVVGFLIVYHNTLVYRGYWLTSDK